MAQAQQKPTQTAFVYGLVCGIALGVSEIALTLLLLWTAYSGLAIFIFRIALILLVLAYLYAGYGAARRTGNLLAGTLAGALTGVFGVATFLWLSTLASFLHMSLQLDPQMLGIPVSAPFFSLMLTPLVRVMLTFAFYGAIVGTFGGFIGRRRSLY